jgi:phospholipid transport system substrate-binding protein
MKTWIWPKLLIALISLTLMSVATAQETDPDKMIDVASKRLLVTLNQERTNYNSNPQALYTKIRNQMRPITDISAIAKGIMGSYYKTATADQRKRFTAAFEKSLIKVYSDSMMEVKTKGFKLKSAAKISPNATKRKVVVAVSTLTGDTFQVSYSMRRNSQNIWLIRNIVADGVNFGLTYRNQFKPELNRSRNNMDQVIASWAQIVEK